MPLAPWGYLGFLLGFWLASWIWGITGFSLLRPRDFLRSAEKRDMNGGSCTHRSPHYPHHRLSVSFNGSMLYSVRWMWLNRKITSDQIRSDPREAHGRFHYRRPTAPIARPIVALILEVSSIQSHVPGIRSRAPRCPNLTGTIRPVHCDTSAAPVLNFLAILHAHFYQSNRSVPRKHEDLYTCGI